MASILSDFKWGFRGVTVVKTGAHVPFDHAHLSEIGHFLVFLFSVIVACKPKGGPIIRFAPDPVRPWYLIWPAMVIMGGRPATARETPDLWMHFEDQTQSHPIVLPLSSVPNWNFQANNLSKSAVALAFEAAFGYPLAVDPETGAGTCVEKSEMNGVHDGCIVSLPCVRQQGKVYQRLVDNRGTDGAVEDLRTPTVKGKPACVFIKRRPVERRFSNDNTECILREPNEVFSAGELAAIARFCAILHLDWGGLDILRDAQSGLIYIVDANRTDMGPPIALPLRDKMKSTRAIGQLLRDTIAQAKLESQKVI